MLLNGKNWQTIWVENSNSIKVIDQTLLPYKLEVKVLNEINDFYHAIKNMIVRGAPLIGVTGAYGLALSINKDPSTNNLIKNKKFLESARPTAVNLKWALDRVFHKIINLNENDRFLAAIKESENIKNEDIQMCSDIGDNGLNLLKSLYAKKNTSNEEDKVLNILTHCNAGWLATVDWGTALAPVYKAHRAGMRIHVWVDETRPRNQGASLTAFELKGENIPHTVVVDNAGGFLMQKNLVDIVIVGSDRTTSTGDVCNKIGTYLKALAAFDNNIPFYAALPFSTIDWNLENGLNSIPIEERSIEEVSFISGVDEKNHIKRVKILPDGCVAFNPAFDVTPSNLVTGLITEKGICEANKLSLESLYMI